MSAASPPLVLILGAGVNGACVARELVLNGVGVWIVDRFDICSGATAKSSRLIHGGLRYLEYGDVGLVRESLRERARLLKLAPQYVRPLRLFIPIRRRFGGLFSAGLRFLRLTRFDWGATLARATAGPGGRGLWTVRMGLWLYDRLAGKHDLPPHSVEVVGQAGPGVDRERYVWFASYSDAQMVWPERFTLALLEDARQAAADRGVEFRMLPHHHAHRAEGRVFITPTDAAAAAEPLSIHPAAIVNATGAWGDFTLQDLPVKSRRLFGGTKGSHIITRQLRLVRALAGEAIYAEADDGRLVFILPFNDAVLVGTTDERFEAQPEQAVATNHEIEYLVEMVNEVFPDVQLAVDDVDSHYCGVRPLPYVSAGSTGSIPRGHWIESTTAGNLPIDTLIGGKLTTCRQLGEEAADRILKRLGVPRTQSTDDRPIPGAEGLSQNSARTAEYWGDIVEQTGFTSETVTACGMLLGSRAVPWLTELSGEDRHLVVGTPFPRGFVRRLAKAEWVARLDDLVERRLMLTDRHVMDHATLTELATLLDIDAASRTATVANAAERLHDHYGIVVTRTS